MELLSKSYHLPLGAVPPIFAYCGAIFALPEAFFFGYSGAIFERSRSLSIDYSGAKYVRSVAQIALTWKSLFRVVEDGKFLNRLRNVHLEKSAVTGICSPSCSPTTAKAPAKVHLRLRFQNLGKPRTAGLCG